MLQIIKGATLEDVKKSSSKIIYYSSRTIWWTEDPKDLQGDSLPIDIFGAPLFEAPKDEFLMQACQNLSITEKTVLRHSWPLIIKTLLLPVPTKLISPTLKYWILLWE